MSLQSLPEDTTSIVLDYLPLEELYKYATNPRSIAILKEQIRKRVIAGDVSPLQLAVDIQDPLLARYALGIMKTLLVAKENAYWEMLTALALELNSTMLLKEIVRASPNPLIISDYLISRNPAYFINAIVGDSELLDIYISLRGRPSIRPKTPYPIRWIFWILPETDKRRSILERQLRDRDITENLIGIPF